MQCSHIAHTGVPHSDITGRSVAAHVRELQLRAVCE